MVGTDAGIGLRYPGDPQAGGDQAEARGLVPHGVTGPRPLEPRTRPELRLAHRAGSDDPGLVGQIGGGGDLAVGEPVTDRDGDAGAPRNRHDLVAQSGQIPIRHHVRGGQQRHLDAARAQPPAAGRLAADAVPAGVRWLPVRDPAVSASGSLAVVTAPARSAAAQAMVRAVHVEAPRMV